MVQKNYNKNQIINHNFLEAKIDSISIIVDKIDNNIKQISAIIDLDLKPNTMYQIA